MNVLDYLETSAARFPKKAAFSDTDNTLSFLDLLASVRRIGTALIRRLASVNRPVVVLSDRNVESVCAFLGVTASRNFYVPVDLSQPVHRISAIMAQMQPAAVIAANDLPAELVDAITVPVLDFQSLLREPEDQALLDSVRSRALDSDPLYAICTSGSTGVPKGVIKSHRSILSFIPVFAETFRIGETDVLGNQAPFDFDVSAKDIYTTLYCGASAFIIPRVCFSMPKKLVEELDDRGVTTLIWSVSALCVAAGVNAFKHRVPAKIRKVLFSGEVMPVRMLNIWRAALPEAMFVNLFGPTEVTGNSLYYIVDRDYMNNEKLPLGIPFRNGDVLFLNEENKPISPGETGEICITGNSLALGYYRDFERTSASFVQNPLNDRYFERMYRTGDLAELRDDGKYYFVARKDFQIKHMGHRIELEEIETFLNATEAVQRAVCLFDHERNKIVAFYSGPANKAEIISTLKKDLPKYMIPNRFIQMDQLPINKNGKIDRQALRHLLEQGAYS